MSGDREVIAFRCSEDGPSAEVTLQTICDLIEVMDEVHDGRTILTPAQSRHLAGLISAARLLADPLRGRICIDVQEVPAD